MFSVMQELKFVVMILIQDKNVTISAEGYFAICLQHEIDHLSGTLFYDHIDANNPWKSDDEAEVI